MKSLKQLLLLGAAASMLGTTLYADVNKGQKIYKKKLQSACGKNGGVFAASHTQEEWQSAYDNGTLGAMMQEECAEGQAVFESDKFNSKYQEHLFDFVHKYASDSGSLPSC